MKLIRIRKVLSAAVAAVLMVTVQCNKDQVAVQDVSGADDSLQKIRKDSLIQDSVKKTAVKYSSFIFPAKKKDSAMAVFTERFSDEEQNAILALNRLDYKNKWRADTLMIPDKIDPTLMLYSPFPAKVKILQEVQKIVLFSYPVQAYALYENGNLIKWGPTSMGKKTAQTKKGLMFANWKKELAISTVDSDWKLPYNFNIHNTLGIGWHQYDLPGYPASHSCLRLTMEDAKYLYNWADQWVLNEGGATVKINGTPVIVFGDYNWGGKKPWKMLAENPDATDISEDEIHSVIEPHLAKIREEQQKRMAYTSSDSSTSSDVEGT